MANKFIESDGLPKKGEIYWNVGPWGRDILSLAISVVPSTKELRKAINRKFGDWGIEYHLPEGERIVEWRLKGGRKVLQKVRRLKLGNK